MAVLAIVGLGSVLGVSALTGYLKTRDPIYQCLSDPNSSPFQLFVPISVIQDGKSVEVPKGIGIEDNCIRPVHTLRENQIHVAYKEPYQFTLGHFLYNWKIDLSKYQIRIFLDGQEYNKGSILDIPLTNGTSIRMEFSSKL